MLPGATDHNTNHLLNIMYIYGLYQLIKELTRVTNRLNQPVKIGERMLRALSDIAKAFTSQFTRIGKDLANTIFNSNVDPLTQVEQTSRSFSFREITINDVLKLLRKIDTNKATGA